MVVVGVSGYIANKKLNVSMGEPTYTPEPTPTSIKNSVGEGKISFANIKGEIYLKFEQNLSDPTVKFFNTTSRSIVRIYGQDEVISDYAEPKILTNLNPSDYKWTNILTGFFDGNNIPENKLGHYYQLFSFKRMPNTDNFLFVTGWFGDDKGNELTIYYYDKNKGDQAKKIVSFNDKLDYDFPKINSFSSEGRYVSLDVFGCWECGGGHPYTFLLDLEKSIIKNIKGVLEFAWIGNGGYQYKDYIIIKCEDNDDRMGPCVQDPKNLPLKTGSF